MRPFRATMSTAGRLFAGVLFAVAVSAPPSRAACPTNSISCDGVTTNFTAPSQSQSCSSGGFASYDDINGQVYSYGYFGGTSTTAQDDFVVTGIPSGSPLTFSAMLQVSSTDCCNNLTGGSISGATIQLAGGPAASGGYLSNCHGCNSFTQTLTIPITTTAGTHFQIAYQARTYSIEAGGGSSSIGGTLSFAGLPPGSIVSSCQGFRQDFIVAVSLASWGRLRLLYR